VVSIGNASHSRVGWLTKGLVPTRTESVKMDGSMPWEKCANGCKTAVLLASVRGGKGIHRMGLDLNNPRELPLAWHDAAVWLKFSHYL
jgi:hypothetical protein